MSLSGRSITLALNPASRRMRSAACGPSAASMAMDDTSESADCSRPWWRVSQTMDCSSGSSAACHAAASGSASGSGPTNASGEGPSGARSAPAASGSSSGNSASDSPSSGRSSRKGSCLSLTRVLHAWSLWRLIGRHCDGRSAWRSNSASMSRTRAGRSNKADRWPCSAR